MVETTDRVLGWHFLRDEGRLGYGDGREAKAGEALESDREPMLCEAGMHASRRLLDALQYAPGALLCRVAIEGEIIEAPDKLVGRRRMVLAMADATDLLHQFACRVAEQALMQERDAGRESDPRSWAAIAAKRKWLRGEMTAGALSAAWSAAWSAARSAAWSAARSAAESAAESAARSELNAELERCAFELLGIDAEHGGG